MNRRTLVLGTVAAAAGVFGVGALLVQQNQTAFDSAPVVSKDTLLTRSYAPIMGNKDAPVTIVEGRPLLQFGANELREMVRLRIETKKKNT